ncbi:amino acid adenylation domain-containing protein [Myxococcota bacterium]|nr:amino acid adenylation domain-containing protein [Myxococcota bacterium]
MENWPLVQGVPGRWSEVRALSPVETSFWLLHQVAPDAAVANAACVFTLDGALDLGALSRALDAFAARHEPMRSSFVSGAEGPEVHVAARVHVELVPRPFHPRSAGELVEIATELQRRPFDLSRAPLLTATLLTESPVRNHLVVVAHHLVCDGTALHLVLPRELFRLYDAFQAGEPSPLAPLPAPYSEFVAWQQSEASGERLEAHRTFWRAHLAGAPKTIELPTDRPRPRMRRYAGARVSSRLPRSTADAVRALAQSLGVRPFDVALAAFAAQLARYTKHTELVVGSPIANRARPEHAPMFGCLINNIVLRLDLSGEPSFAEIVRRVSAEGRAIRAHRDLPFSTLFDELGERDQPRTPVYQVLFNYMPFALEPMKLRQVEVTPTRVDPLGAVLELSLELAEDPDGYSVWLEHDTEIFDAATAERMLAHYRTLLEGAVAEPERTLPYLPLLPAAERDRVLVEWNRTAAEYPEGNYLPDLLWASARAHASDVAIADSRGASQATYAELFGRAAQLAHHLRAQGVGPGSLVAVWVRSPERALLGILATLATGAAYVPINAIIPTERLALVLDDARPALILTEAALLGQLPSTPTRRLVIDPMPAAIDGLPTEPPERTLSPDDPAYVIYTSGSTGRPKGIVAAHGNAAHQFLARRRCFDSAPGTFILLHSLAFDSAAAVAFWTLGEGGRLVLPEEDLRKDSRAIRAAVASAKVTHLDAVPSLYSAILGDARPGELDSLEVVVLGGEEVTRPLLERHRAVLPNVRLINEYGPSEATVFCTTHELTDETCEGRLPIGRPIPNARLYVLDAHRQPVPLGQPGELWIGGAGVTPGYLNRPELTAERFVPDPFLDVVPKSGGWDSGMMYKSGDLVRQRTDGALEFLGRVDRQVKVHGFRIELEEIQRVLELHASVRRAAVVLRPRGDSHRLIGYVVPAATGAAPSPSELRRFLLTYLPEVMVPSAFVTMPDLPSTAIVGKIDYSALPEPADGHDASDTYAAPRDELEARLVKVWEQLLGRTRVGVHDDFFALGGHSLLAVKLLDRVEEVARKRPTLSTFFRNPTISGLAGALASPDRRRARALDPVQPRGSLTPLFFVGSPVYARTLAPLLGDGRPVYSLNFFGLFPEGGEPRPVEVSELARAYVEEVRDLQPHGPYQLASFCLDGKIALEMAQRLRASGEEVSYVACIDLFVGEITRNHRLGTWLHRGERRLRELKERGATMIDRAQVRAKGALGDSTPLRNYHLRMVEELNRAYDRHQVAPYAGRVRMFIADEFHESSAEPLRRIVPRLDVTVVPGFHDKLFAEPQLSMLARQVKKDLDALAALQEVRP